MIDIETGGWLCINLILWDFIVAERDQQVDLLYNSFFLPIYSCEAVPIVLKPRSVARHDGPKNFWNMNLALQHKAHERWTRFTN